jgi:NhaP-type Na+/H+ or K+/H+ antiporter
MVYLCVGFLIGTAGAGMLPVSLDSDVRTLRIVTEVGLVVSLFSIGMHLRVSLHAATDPKRAHAYMAESMKGFTREIERLVEFALMLAIGSAVSAHWREVLTWPAIWPALMLFLVARPVGTSLALVGANVDGYQRVLIGWMGIRGVGAFYYLLLALQQGGNQFRPLASVILASIALSVIVHGSSATPALNRYFRRQHARSSRQPRNGIPPKPRRYDSAGW